MRCLLQAKIGAASRRRWLARTGIDVSALSDQDIEQMRAERAAARQPRLEARRAAAARRAGARQVTSCSPCPTSPACF